jgi:hypothetical protein
VRWIAGLSGDGKISRELTSMPVIHLIDGAKRSRWVEVPDLRPVYYWPRKLQTFYVPEACPVAPLPYAERVAEFRRTDRVDDIGVLIYEQILQASR